MVAQVASTRSADPAAPVGGFSVDAVRYLLDPGDPTRARTVTFRLRGGAPAHVEVRVGGRAVVCRPAGPDVVCDLGPGVPVRALEALRVVATG